MHESSDGSAPRHYVRDRLRRDHPALYERVVAGEMTTHAASVEAGFRPRMRSVDITSPANAIRYLCRVFDPDELRAALDEIDREPDARVEDAIAQALRAVDEAREVMRPEREP
jgi:hypothetical protein